MPDLVKLALNPAVMAAMTRSIKGLGAGAGMGAALGGAGGAALGAVRGYQKAGDEGTSRLGGALGGAWGGAGKGALLGGAIGGAVGAARPAYAEALTPHLPGSHFGQRQVHALTGVGDTAYVRSIGGGSHDAEQRLQAAYKGRLGAMGGNAKKYQAAQTELEGAHKGLAAAQKAEQMGLTSLPGYAKALAKNPLQALKAGVSEQWHSMDNGGKAFLFGAPAAFAANELAHGGKDEEGHGRFERTARSVGQGLAYMTGPMSIAGQSALDPVLSGAFGRLGKGADRFAALHPRHRRNVAAQVTAASAPDPAGGDSQAEGHILSDRAAGVVPEGINA